MQITPETNTDLAQREEAENLVSPGFRIGNPDSSKETIYKGRRTYYWQPNGFEYVGEIAGWSSLPHAFDETRAFLEVPEGTRSASSVIAGVEAWEGEHEQILTFIADYLRAVKKEHGAVDVSVALDTVAVPKDRKVFVAPPHLLSTDSGANSDWAHAIFTDVSHVLGTNRDNALLERFASQLEEIVG